MSHPFGPGVVAALPRMPPGPVPRVSIERLPSRRPINEPREAMNCKSCRKRKIKCNRLRPSCEACQVFQCPCIYDAVPKKRGPKTDVLEALLKRVDGLEARLKEKTEGEAKTSDDASVKALEGSSVPQEAGTTSAKSEGNNSTQDSLLSPAPSSSPPPEVPHEALIDIYFSRFHDKPFHIFDESTFRQRLQLNQLPNYLLHALYAVAARCAPHPNGFQAAAKLSEQYSAQARREIDTDEPSVDALQALILLVTAFTAQGKGKKAYMLLTSAVGMAMALELHRELDINARVTSIERETRRRLFWTCYLLDRFLSCGSRRPCLISDRAILLRLPCWSPNPASLPIEGDFFQSYANFQHIQAGGKKHQGSSAMLIDICRILGITNQYLAAGGVKGDSHFPWHSLSNLSKIRQELDIWASGTEEVFSSLNSLFRRPDSTMLVLSKLIYHLIHCLIYRPFLPIDLAELAGSGQHQSWQIEATNLCFLHANAITELVELGRQAGSIEWPAFVGYCICTAGTVHIHGAHYSRIGNAGDMNVFASSADFLSREMQQLSELRLAWACVQHQRETLQQMYNAHSELVKSLAHNPMRYSPVFHLEDFFDRYSNMGGGSGGPSFSFDTANLGLCDVVLDFAPDTNPNQNQPPVYTSHLNQTSDPGPPRPSPLKRKSSMQSGRPRPELSCLLSLNNTAFNTPPTPAMSTPSSARRSMFATPTMPSQPSPSMMHSPTPLTSPHGLPQKVVGGFTANANNHPTPVPHNNGLGTTFGNAGGANSASTATPGFGLSASGNGSGTHHLRSPTTGPANGQGFDHGLFGGIPANTFSTTTPPGWNSSEDKPGGQVNNTTVGNINATGPSGSVSTTSDTSPATTADSTGTTGGPGEEKDPFLSLLEQLAENEGLLGGTGSDLDFFLTGTPAPPPGTA